ncbi:cation:proton antiporter [Actinoplanes oblitus]|uniref:Cation:proton antiporter n=1 Tax=Actinoplanes oblitus TaxID=3040509 RepID=A0ABY8W655_9ACTN|nr:cation:proton antiporter [Actinoplanes oblitus]WIM92822.1 cation:proton antiporter [Actinoplanes oblitus]
MYEVTCAVRELPDTVRFLLAAAVVVALAAAGGALAARGGQPRVLGEILAGLLLGPLGLATVAPAAVEWLRLPDTATAVRALADLGIALFAYLIGYELRTAGRPRSSAVLTVTAGAVVVPVLAGLAVAPVIRPVVGAAGVPGGVFAGFLALVCAVTALPVLARLLPDVELAGTTCGRLALTVAACTDALVWAGLTVLLAVAGRGSVPVPAWAVVAALFGLVVVALAVLRPVVRWVARRSAVAGAGPAVVPLIVVSVALFAAVTHGAGLHAAPGALLAGVVMPRVPAVERANQHLEATTSAVLLPLYFGSIGLAMPLGALSGGRAEVVCFALLLAVMTVAKAGGAWLGALPCGLPAADRLRLGVLLNCRGVTEVVVLTIGFERHIVGAAGFATLLLVTLAGVAVVAPVCRRLPGAVRNVSPGPHRGDQVQRTGFGR